MGKIIDSILTTYGDAANPRPTISFEFFPAKTDDGVFNLLNRVEEMGFSLRPTFVTLTWRSAFKDEKLWLRIGAHIQKEFQLDVLLHLTCHLPREQIKEILRNARACGIRSASTLRMPPSHQAKVLDLERLKLKQDAGADFIITQFFFDTDGLLQWVKDCRDAGISIPILPGYLPIQNYNSFLKFTSWCKTKVPRDVLLALEKIKNDDAAVKRYGTELAIQTCKKIMDAGIKSLHFYTMNLASTVTSVLEGLDLIPTRNQRDLPWQSTLRRTNSNGKETEQVRPIFWSNRQASYIARTSEWDDFPNGRWGDRTSPAYGDLSEYYLAFKRPKVNRKQLWGTPQTQEDVWGVFAKFIEGTVKQLPWCEQTLSNESIVIKENLKWVNAHGFLTINSQPRVNGAPSSDPSVGWGSENGFVFQKAYLEFFASPRLLEKLLVAIKDYPKLSFHAMNLKGEEHTNTPAHSVTAVTWGVFPGQEIVQPTVVDSDSFAAWKDEAFELWQTQWASAYEPESASHAVIQDIYNSYFLVNIVDNDYTNDDSDVFGIFTRIITEDMNKDDLRDRVIELEAKNEKLHETIAKFQSIHEELAKDLQDTHAQLGGLRDENQALKMQLRQFQARAALSTL